MGAGSCGLSGYEYESSHKIALGVRHTGAVPVFLDHSSTETSNRSHAVAQYLSRKADFTSPYFFPRFHACGNGTKNNRNRVT